MPQVNSPTSSQVLVTNHQICHSEKGPKSMSEQSRKNSHSIEQVSDPISDDAVTSKTPTARKQIDLRLSDRSTDEEIIKSDGETSMAGERDSPQYMSASSDDDEDHQNEIAPSKGWKERRLSQSLILDDSQIRRALKTFSASKS